MRPRLLLAHVRKRSDCLVFQRGLLQSASNGSFGDRLILAHPTYGDIQVAVIPGAEGYQETPYEPVSFGYEIGMRFLRLE